MSGRVIVSTDCREIERVAIEYGAEVFRRSHATATDTASSESAVLEVLDWLSLEPNEPVVMLQATSPIRQRWDIDAAIALCVDEMCDSVFSAREVQGYTWTVSDWLVYRNYERKPRQLEDTSTLEEERFHLRVSARDVPTALRIASADSSSHM